MSLTTCAVSCLMYGPDGEPEVGARFEAKLDRPEVAAGFIVPDLVAGTTDASGVCVLNLWPNQLGTTESVYTIKMTSPAGRTVTVTAVVPDTGTANLHDITTLPPYPGKSDGALTVEAAVTAGQVALAAADSATNSKDAALAAQSGAESAQGAAEAARDAAQASEAAAATSQGAAAGSATAAASSATAAAGSATAASGSAAAAQTAKTGADSARDTAQASATTATGAASTASTAATTATSAATTATTKAGEASTSALAAQASENNAAASASTATTKAAEAAASATSAANSASSAMAYRVQPGAVMMYARDTPPAGWLKANGAEISRSAYADLFSAIGTTFGAGDGATTFKLPDLRGEFMRGWDDGRGIDAGRVFGSAQSHAFASHTHVAVTANEAWTSGGLVAGSTTKPSGAYNSTYNTTSATGGTETRPRNVALLPCIKF